MEVPYVDIGAQYRSQRDTLLPLLDECLSSGAYILGAAVETFERDFSAKLGVKHAISVANGTDSLILSMKALGIGPGDEVITVANSWISSVASIALIGAIPVLVDVGHDQLMDPKLIEAKITSKTRAIMPVHLTGKSADMNYIMEIARKHKLSVIEDAAQAVGSKFIGKSCGAIGDVGSFSLHPLKNLNAAGDAGIITTQNDDLAAKIRLLRNHGQVARNEVACFGYNSRLDTLQAVILNHRLAKLDSIIAARRQNARYYQERLAKYVTCPFDQEGSFDTYHLFVIQCDRRDELKAFLADSGVHTAIHYPIPIHQQQAFKALHKRTCHLPETERQAKRILSLPVHQMLSSEQVTYTAEKIVEFYRKA